MLNIAVDGTSASGKSSVCKAVASRLKIVHLNTGAMYRSYALFAIRENINTKEDSCVDKLLKGANIQVKIIDNKQYTFLNGEDVSNILQTNEISNVSAIISQFKEIRKKVKAMQIDIAKKYNVLIEGRDIGTKILPRAKYKFFITASLEERANRRFKQLKESNNLTKTWQEIYDSLKERDYLDEHRKISPLCKAKDAILVDSTNMSFDEVVNFICDIIEKGEN
jgi:CMP/dCMP kinase